MKARPIPMLGPMVNALLEGRKSQTRRIIKPQPEVDGGSDAVDCLDWWLEWKGRDEGMSPKEMARLCPYGRSGDLLWVREAWRTEAEADAVKPSELRVGAPILTLADTGVAIPCPLWGRYRHARFMPRWASRLTLELIDVRVEQLKDIGDAETEAEGLIESAEYDNWYWSFEEDGAQYCSPVFAYEALWKSLHGEGSWDANPWIWVLTFRVHQKNVDSLLKAKAA